MSGRRTRRRFLHDVARLGGGLAGLGLLVSCAPTPAPTAPARVYRVGLLATSGGRAAAFWEQMAELGYVEGKNLVREERVSLERLDDDAVELARLPVDVIVAVSLEPVRSATKATTTIPIVQMGGGNPVRQGFVDSMARPGRNVTGVFGDVAASGDLELKRIELLVEAAPHVTRVAVFGPQPVMRALAEPEARSVARSLGVELLGVPITVDTTGADYEAAFERMRVEGVDAVQFRGGGSLGAFLPLLVSLIERAHLPAVSQSRSFVTSGGLMSYGPRVGETERQAASYVDRILRGAKPADLPVEQSRGYELIVNMRTARALGLTLSQDFLDQVTEVIE